MDKFSRVSAGQNLAISASTWNALLENAERQSRSQFNQGSGTRSPQSFQSGLIVRVKNDSGTDVEQFCPLMLSGESEFSISGEEMEDYSFQHTPILIGVEPEDDPDKAFVVTLEPIADGEFGKCIVSGIAVASVNITHASHTHVTLKNEDLTQLDSAMFGHRIIYKPSGTGTEKLCYILIGSESCNPYKAIATEAISPNTSGTFKFATGDLGSLTAIGSNFTGYYPSLVDGSDIAEDAELFVSCIQGQWIITPIECPE